MPHREYRASRALAPFARGKHLCWAQTGSAFAPNYMIGGSSLRRVTPPYRPRLAVVSPETRRRRPHCYGRRDAHLKPLLDATLGADATPSPSPTPPAPTPRAPRPPPP